MSILERLERKFGRYTIPNLMKYICVMYAVGFLIQLFAPEFYFYYLDLDPEAILHGHIWRVLTFLIYYPASYGFSSILWGNFRYNFFFFSGVLLYNVAGILIFLLTGVSLQLNPTYMGFSIFLAYSLTLPDTVFYLYFFIPIKAKYLALFETVLYLYFLLVSQSAGERLSILLSFLNVLLFFLLMHQGRRKNIFNIRNYR